MVVAGVVVAGLGWLREVHVGGLVEVGVLGVTLLQELVHCLRHRGFCELMS